jgi:Skp family chaperone for outer membrane proteins
MYALRYRFAAKWLTGLAALAALVALTGCEWQSKQPATTAGAVAVIDLDAIAQRLGSDKQMAASINQRQSALNQQLVELAKNYNAQLAERQKSLDANQGQEGEVTLASWQQQANANLNQVKKRAAQDLQSHRLQLVTQFRERIKPAARRVAEARGLSVIVTKNDSVVFDFTGAADITEEVISELSAGRTP